MNSLVTKFEVPKNVPEQIRESLELLTGAAFVLSRSWQLYRGLFIEAPKNLELAKKNAPDFFEWVQIVLYKDILMGISRFTDNNSLHKENQSVCLAELFVETKLALLKELSQLAEKSKNIRKVRNKVIAHLDRKYATNPNLLPTKKILTEIEQSVELIEKIIDMAWRKWVSTDKFVATISFGGEADASQILRNLKKAEIYDRLERSKVVPWGLWSHPEDLIQKFIGALPHSQKNS
jgi:AbiU2